MRVRIGSIGVDAVSLEQTVSRVAAAIAAPASQCFRIATANAQFVDLARRDTGFAGVLERSDLCVADGLPLVWASRLLESTLPGRVNGTDLMVRLSREASLQGWSVYFLGGHPGSAEAAARRLVADYPGLRVAGIDCPPRGFVTDPAADAAASRRIAECAPDIVFVALGAPRQELWIDTHRHLPAKVMMGVGGSFELIAGTLRRAPLLLQKIGCEWLWRLCLEPGRLWKRYLTGNSIFVVLVLTQWLSRLGSSFASPRTEVHEELE